MCANPILTQHVLPYPKAVLFDWDNTLVQSAPGNRIAFKNFLERIDYPMQKENFKDHPQGSRHLFPKLFGDDWQDMLLLYHEELIKVHLNHVDPLSDAKKFLDILYEKRIYMAVVSNKNGTFLRREIKHLLWESYFNSVIGCFDLSYDKPSPEPAYHVLEQGQIQPGSDVWFIGDSWVDYECAVNAKLTPIIIGQAWDDYPQHPSMVRVENYKKLIELFQNVSVV